MPMPPGGRFQPSIPGGQAVGRARESGSLPTTRSSWPARPRFARVRSRRATRPMAPPPSRSRGWRSGCAPDRTLTSRGPPAARSSRSGTHPISSCPSRSARAHVPPFFVCPCFGRVLGPQCRQVHGHLEGCRQLRVQMGGPLHGVHQLRRWGQWIVSRDVVAPLVAQELACRLPPFPTADSATRSADFRSLRCFFLVARLVSRDSISLRDPGRVFRDLAWLHGNLPVFRCYSGFRRKFGPRAATRKARVPASSAICVDHSASNERSAPRPYIGGRLPQS